MQDYLRATLTPDKIGFALRTWAAAMLALFISFVLQLESPYWTLLAVWILAVPAPGMLLSKGLYFVMGTLLGAVLGIMLMALFAQAPELFVLALALLVAASTVASNLLTNFRAYGTVLVGYTAGIVAAGAINTPDQVFFIGMARVAAILTGGACSVFITSIFGPHRAEAATRARLCAVLKDAAKRAGYSWQAADEERYKIGRKLVFDLIAIDTEIEYAAAESAAFRVQADQARSLLAHLFSLASARRALDAHLRRCGWPRHEGLEIFHSVILDFLNEMPDRLDKGEINESISGLDQVRRQLEQLRPEDDNPSAGEIVSRRYVIDRMHELLDHMEGALTDWSDIAHGTLKAQGHLTLNFHRDHRAAWINGLRAFIAVSAVGAFWIASAWDYGTLALVFVSVLLSLISSRPRPDLVGWTFFKAGVLATIFALPCKYYILAYGSDFSYLILALGLIFVPLALIMANPSTAVAALNFAFVFCYVVKPDNFMAYDLSDSINTALAVLIGILVGTFAYVYILPPDPAAARRYVTYRIRRGLQDLATARAIPHFCYWETRMYDRVVRLYDPQNPSGTHTNEWYEAGLGAITLGNDLLRLRYWLQSEHFPPGLQLEVERVIAAFAHFYTQPEPAVAEVKSGIQKITQLDPGLGREGRRAWARVLGALDEIDVYLTQNPKLIRIASTPQLHPTGEPEGSPA